MLLVNKPDEGIDGFGLIDAFGVFWGSGVAAAFEMDRDGQQLARIGIDQRGDDPRGSPEPDSGMTDS